MWGPNWHSLPSQCQFNLQHLQPCVSEEMNAVLGELLLSELQSMDQIVENAEPEDEKDMARGLSHPHDQWPKPVKTFKNETRSGVGIMI